MTSKEAKQYVLSQEPTFLPRAKNVGGRHSFCCPFDGCKNGTGKDGTGITLVPGSQNHPKYHCFVCGESGDVFDLAKAYFGLSSLSEVFESVYQYYGIEVENDNKFHSKPKLSFSVEDAIKKAKENTNKSPVLEEVARNYENQLDYINKVRANLDPSYLEKRGISKETQKHYWVGTDLNWRNPVTVSRYQQMNWPIGQIKVTPRCIIPTSTQSYLARDIRPEETIPDNEKRFMKMKYGTVPIFNVKRSSQEDIVFVTEGEIDAMSIYEVSKVEPTALGSTSNWRQFVNLVKDDPDRSQKVFVLLLDNDAPGQKTQNSINEALTALGCKVLTPPLGEYNDPNQFLKENPKAFKKLITQAMTIAKTYLPVNVNEKEFDMDR